MLTSSDNLPRTAREVEPENGTEVEGPQRQDQDPGCRNEWISRNQIVQRRKETGNALLPKDWAGV